MKKRMKQRLSRKQVENLKLTDIEIYEIVYNQIPLDHYTKTKEFSIDKYTYETWLNIYVTQRRGKLDYEASALLGIGSIIEVLHNHHECMAGLEFDCGMWQVITTEKTGTLYHGDDEAIDEELIDILYRAWYRERAKQNLVEYELI